jgi:hypothetical protein
VVGLTAGIPLVIVWIGLLILPLVFAAWYGFIAFERQMAIGMLREQIPPITYQDFTGKSLWQKFIAAFSNPVTWKGLLYLFAKFPLGTFNFIVMVTLLSVGAAFAGLPFYYPYLESNISITLDGLTYFNPVWVIDTMPEAIIGSLIGILIILVSLHLFNGLAWVSGKFARVMLGSFSAPVAVVPAAPAAVEPAIVEPAPVDPPAPEE